MQRVIGAVDDWKLQIWQVVVLAELHDFAIDKNQFQFAGRVSEHQGVYARIHKDAFAASRATRNQQMRGFCQIKYHCVSIDVLAHHHRQPSMPIAPCGGTEHFFSSNHCAVTVGNFKATVVLA